MPTYNINFRGVPLEGENITHSVVKAVASLDSCAPTSLAWLTTTTLDLSSSATRTLDLLVSDQVVQPEDKLTAIEVRFLADP